MKRVMYVEYEGDELDGPGRVGWVELSRSRRAYRYRGKLLHKVAGYKYNCVDAETGERYWVSGPKKNGEDRHWAGSGKVEIDEDVREEYLRDIRVN